jgi:uncharacterized protein (DUF1501 family)
MKRIIDDTGFSAKRRELLKGSAAWAAGSAGAFAFNMQCMAQAANPTDYKALVCIFLFGGNDNGNTLIPYDQAQYNAYLTAREGSTARPYQVTRLRSDLLPIATASITDGRSFGLPKEMSALKGLYDSGKAAIIANLGMLSEPTTRSSYENASVEIPPQLFSHSDQATFWQAGVPSYTTSSGWGGRIVDLFASANSNGRVSSSVSIAGTNLWQVGNQVIPFPIDADDGAVELYSMDEAAYSNAMNAMWNATRSNVFEREVVRVYRRSVAGAQAVSDALLAANAIDAQFPRSAPPEVPGPARGWHASLMSQLSAVARMISSRNLLGLKRQTFFVSIGGFDMHNTLEHHRYALQAISDAMAKFYTVTNQLGVADKVTTFTASDFGRPLQVNGTGSDHGWGGHHFVVGGAVNGGNLYGMFPNMTLSGPNYTGQQGHLIPTTSVDQYAATMAKWFGVSASDISQTVVPRVGRFATADLGFMTPG